jgi:hypothetical protein
VDDDVKENGVYAPTINARSKILTGKREGAVSDRLHEEAIEREARRQRAIEAAQAQKEAEALEAGEGGVPKINEVSAQLTAGRAGAVSDRLFDSHKELKQKQVDRAKLAKREAEASTAATDRSEGL